MTLNHNLVLLAVGHTDYLNEAFFSLLSFYRYNVNSSVKVILYTDSPDYFNRITASNFTVKQVSTTEINLWKGQKNYLYRIKIKALQQAISSQSGSYLFVDTDTIFRQNIDEIFYKIDQQNLFLDQCEGPVQNKPGGIAKKVRSLFRKKNRFILQNSEEIIFKKDFEVWNSGVIGLHSNYSALLFNTEELLDQLYKISPVFTVEQLALGYFFQQTNKLEATENYIHHYWYFKEFRKVLDAFFHANKSKTFDELLLESSKIDPELFAQPKLAYKRKTFMQKTLQKIFKGYKWKMPKYPAA
jgi:hypothetical protein